MAEVQVKGRGGLSRGDSSDLARKQKMESRTFKATLRCGDARQDLEGARMLENAVSLFTINATKLLRYAGRRHCREVFEQELNDLGL